MRSNRNSFAEIHDLTGCVKGLSDTRAEEIHPEVDGACYQVFQHIRGRLKAQTPDDLEP